MKVRLFISLLTCVACVSCHQKTKADCEADYKEAVKECDVDEDKCETDVKAKRQGCRSIKDRTTKQKCFEEARQDDRSCSGTKEKCKEDAKKDRDRCKKNAKN